MFIMKLGYHLQRELILSDDLHERLLEHIEFIYISFVISIGI